MSDNAKKESNNSSGLRGSYLSSIEGWRSPSPVSHQVPLLLW